MMRSTVVQLVVGGALLLTGCGGPAFSSALEVDAGDEGAVATRPASDSGLAAELDSGVALDAVALDAVASGEARASDGWTGGADGGDGASDALVCSVPTSPLMTGTGGIHGGIQFHVTRDVTLTSFTFTGQGLEDVVTLSDDACAAIASASTPAEALPGYAPYVVRVAWPLSAGKSYRLTNASGQTAFGGYPLALPYASGVLVVENGLVVCPDSPQGSMVWTAFTDLTFCEGS